MFMTSNQITGLYRSLRKEKLQLSSFAALLLAEEGVGAADISRTLGMNPANMTSIMDLLERQGLGTRRIDTKDRRRIIFEVNVRSLSALLRRIEKEVTV